MEYRNLERNLKIVDTVSAVAADHGVSAARVALAWLLSRGPDIVPIPGVRKISELVDSFGAVDVRLSAGEIARLDAAAPVGATAGNRYCDTALDQVGR